MKTSDTASRLHRILWQGVVAISAFCLLPAAFAFEGRINATLTRGGQTQTFLYTVGTNYLRIERAETNWPYARDIVDLQSGDTTLLFPHNRSFVRLKPASENAAPFPGMPAMPPPAADIPQGNVPPSGSPPGPPTMPMPPGGLPPGLGPQAGHPPGASGMPNMPPMPAGMGVGAPGMAGGMPMMPMPPMERAELKATGETTNLLGYICARYELKQRGEVMEIWATDKLMPFRPYQQNQPHRFGPRMIEEQWGDLLKAKKLFPLLAVLRFEPPHVPARNAPAPPGPERLRFEVKSVTPEKITDDDGKLFQPPPDYREIQPLPF